MPHVPGEATAQHLLGADSRAPGSLWPAAKGLSKTRAGIELRTCALQAPPKMTSWPLVRAESEILAESPEVS